MVWLASTLVFVLLRLAPGDPYSTRLDGFPVSESQRALWRSQRALDAPLMTQYVHWVANSARGNLGWSSMHQRPVADVLAELLPRTLSLLSLGLVSSLVFGMALGAWQGARGGDGDAAVSAASLVVYSVPQFWLALLLLQLFAHELGWLPASGMVEATHDYLGPLERVKDRIRHLLLPWLSLTLIGTAVFARYQRSAMRDAWRAPFVDTARAKGLPDWRVGWHAWRTALTPVITLAGLVFPSLLGGAVFVERVFSWPGMGNATVLAVGARDYEFVTAAVLVGSAMTVTGSLLADWLQGLVDPRVRP